MGRRFSQKHYVAVAQLLNDAQPRPHGPFEVQDYHKKLVDRFVTMFSHDSPRFDEQRFRKAVNLPRD